MVPLIYDLAFADLSGLLESWNEPKYRAGQLWHGLYRSLFRSWADFSNLPAPLTDRLGKELPLMPLEVVRQVDSSDGKTRKTLLGLHDGVLVEAVLMRYDPDTSTERGRQTLCISSQAGCAMGCVFCATGQMGFKRNLSSGEIVGQVMYYAGMLRDERRKVTNIVFMGMGEPFHNYENTMAAIDRLNDPSGYNFGARRITVSTVGLAPQIRRFADERRQVNLAVSLHAADDDSRQQLLPVNGRYKIEDLLDACRYYVSQTGRRITFEWALIAGVNDTEAVAQRLTTLLRGLRCHVNAIPLNPTRGYGGVATQRANADWFCAYLETRGIPCTIRERRGIDVAAGCGQLAGGGLG
jgi:23S rRNA (adenine2503-C2)-methyltransferase